MFESLCCGTPAVVVSSYEHQIPQTAWFGKRDLIVDLGYRNGPPDHDSILNTIELLVRDFPRRQRLSRRGMDTVDGLGLSRFVDIVRQELRYA